MKRLYLVIFSGLIALTSFAQPLPRPKAPTGSTVFFKSLLLPGWGQMSQGRPKEATIFLSSEAILIVTTFGLQTYGDWLKSDYRSVAALYAGIPNGGNRNHTMYVDMGNWNTVEEFNAARQRDREYDRQYLKAEDQWRWTNDSERRRFKALRLKSDKVLESVKFSIGAVVVNHFIAAIEASAFERKKVKNPSIGVTMSGTTSEPQVRLHVNW